MFESHKIIEPPKFPIDAYEFANLVAGLTPGDEGYNSVELASRAARDMRAAGWVFQGYNDAGEETYLPPEPQPCGCGYDPTLAADGRWYCSVCGDKLS